MRLLMETGVYYAELRESMLVFCRIGSLDDDIIDFENHSNELGGKKQLCLFRN